MALVDLGVALSVWLIPAVAASTPLSIRAVAAENFYANAASQIGGTYVATIRIMNNPNSGSHTYESSLSDANTIGAADVVIH